MNPSPKLTQAVVDGNQSQATAATVAAIESGVEPAEVLNALVAGMTEVGRRWKANELFLPEVLIAARAMNESMAVLEPHLVAGGVEPEVTAVIGTVRGDLHDIGKNLVAIMWKGANIRVHDLGTDVAPEEFVDAVREHDADVVGLSALLTSTMPGMRRTVEAIRAAGLDGVKIVIGGASVTQSYADEIGADGYASDAVRSVDKVKALIAG
jgi:5-methyltetrahydrofolate--homocysteine methyltransferase